MTPEEELILRNYLRRKIAEKNMKFAKMSSKFQNPAKAFRIELFRTFARGTSGSNAAIPSNLNIMSVFEHMNRYCTGVSPYNYFDLDTLIAYDAFLDRLFFEAEAFKDKDCRDFYNISDFEKAKYVTHKFFVENEGTMQTGYYDLSCPVRILRNENRRPVFERTPTAKSFDRQYKFTYCEELLDDYLAEKHLPQSVIATEEVKNVNQQELEESDVQSQGEDCDFLFRGVPYLIDFVEYYLDSELNPIRYVYANSLDNTSILSGCFDSRMEPYEGEIYDMEYNEVTHRHSGVSVMRVRQVYDEE